MATLTWYFILVAYNSCILIPASYQIFDEILSGDHAYNIPQRKFEIFFSSDLTFNLWRNSIFYVLSSLW